MVLRKILLKEYLWTRSSLSLFFTKRPNILSFDDTVREVAINKKSFIRFGDGEMRLALSEGKIGFQQSDKELTDRLNEILTSPDLPTLLIGLPDTFKRLNQYNIDSQVFWYGFNMLYLKKFLQNIKYSKIYGETNITRFYMPFKDKSNTLKRITKLKTIWDHKDVLIVEGTDTKLGVGNDLFSNVQSIERIICPSKNAFSKYNEILEVVSSVGGNKLILIALGPTASVLAYDLAIRGFWAVDIGHIDIEYMWFLQNARKKEAVAGKYVNETNMQNNTTTEEDDDNYVSSIIATIL